MVPGPRSSSTPRQGRERRASLVARVVAALLGIGLATGAALAHTGHDGHAGGGGPNVALPAALLVGGILVLGTSVYLDRTDQLGSKLADAGVLLGVLGLLAGITLALV